MRLMPGTASRDSAFVGPVEQEIEVAGRCMQRARARRRATSGADLRGTFVRGQVYLLTCGAPAC